MELTNEQIKSGIKIAKKYFKFHERINPNQIVILESVLVPSNTDEDDIKDIKKKYIIDERELNQIERYFKFEGIDITAKQRQDLGFIIRLVLNDPQYDIFFGGIRDTLNKKMNKKTNRSSLDWIIHQIIKDEKALLNIDKDINQLKADCGLKLSLIQKGKTIFELDDTLIIKKLLLQLQKEIGKKNINLPKIGGKPSNRHIEELSESIFEYLIDEMKISLTDDMNTSSKHHRITGQLLSICNLEITEKEFSNSVQVGELSKMIQGNKVYYNPGYMEYLDARYKKISKNIKSSH